MKKALFPEVAMVMTERRVTGVAGTAMYIVRFDVDIKNGPSWRKP